MRLGFVVGIVLTVFGSLGALSGAILLAKQRFAIAGLESAQAKLADTPVVGVGQSASLCADPELKNSAHVVAAGTVLSIVAERDHVLHVKAGPDQEGWIERYRVCSQREFNRRTRKREVPKRSVHIGRNGNGSFFYGGGLSIQNDQLVMAAGDSFWLDESMKGKEFRFAGKNTAGEPDVLLLTPEKGDAMIRLPVWGNKELEAKLQKQEGPPLELQEAESEGALFLPVYLTLIVAGGVAAAVGIGLVRSRKKQEATPPGAEEKNA